LNIHTYDKAWEIARNAHRGQKYGAYDYMYHIQSVVSRCATWGDYRFKDEAIIVAIMHDVFEDHPETKTIMSFELWLEIFGRRTLNALAYITKQEDETYHQYIVRCSKDEVARMVKSCDLVENLTALEFSNMDVFRKTKLRDRYTDAMIYLMNH